MFIRIRKAHLFVEFKIDKLRLIYIFFCVNPIVYTWDYSPVKISIVYIYDLLVLN